MKDKIIEALGVFGFIIWHLMQLIACLLPFVFIGLNIWLTLILIAIDLFLPFFSPVFWIWGLVKAITGPQNWLAVLYYIATVVVFLPFVLDTFSNFFRRKY